MELRLSYQYWSENKQKMTIGEMNQIVIILLILLMQRKEVEENVIIKSKYQNLDQQRKLIVSPDKSLIAISSPGKPEKIKKIHINDLQSHQNQGRTVKISFNNGRTYQISTRDSEKIRNAIDQTQRVELSRGFVQQTAKSVPKSINYLAMKPMLSTLNPLQQIAHFSPFSDYSIQQAMKSSQKQPQPQEKKERNYLTASYFADPYNWELRDDGHLIVINEEWKSNTSNIVGFVVKKILTTGSFMGISFPVFAMKPQSILQSYAKSFGIAPKIFSNIPKSQRIRNYIIFVFTISLLQIDVRKPFNPVIGETFQAEIGGGSFSAEQICHHPPISGFYYEGQGYSIYGQLELSASIGMNSGEGRFIGDITVQFQDGYWIKGRIPNGQLSGLLIGDVQFQTYGGIYAYDSEGVVCTMEMGKQNLFKGYIGRLNAKYSNLFKEKMNDIKRFIKFEAFKRQKYSSIQTQVIVKPCNWIKFNDKLVFDFFDPKNLPYLPEPIENKRLFLASDSNLREDIILCREGKIEQSQLKKQELEEQQRYFRKLREQYKRS